MKIVFTSSFTRPLPLLVSIFTLSKISHCEFLFSDGISIFPSVYSKKVILTRKTYPENTSITLNLNTTVKEEKIIRKWAESQLGVGYDFRSCIPPGLDRIISRKKENWQDPSSWMCSEFCAYGLELIGWDFFENGFFKIRPCDLYYELSKRNKNGRVTYR